MSPSTFPPDRILVPSDYSERSDHALEYASSLAAAHGARVVLLHVLSPLAGSLQDLAMAPDYRFVELVERRHESAMNELHRRKPAAYEGKVEYSAHVEEGEAAAVIARVATEQDCDLVVMGSHGRTGLRRALLGSVAERTARLAEVPVLILR